jgi:hypothetical protein
MDTALLDEKGAHSITVNLHKFVLRANRRVACWLRRNLKVSLHRNFVVAHSSPIKTICGFNITLKVGLRRNKPLCGVLSRCSLRGSLRCSRDTVGRSPPVREREAAGLPAPNASHRRVRPAIPQNVFPGVPTGLGMFDKLSLAFIFSIRIMRALPLLKRHWFIVF